MDDIWDVDDWVEEATQSSVRKFYLVNVESSVNLPLRKILARLFSLAMDGKIEILYQAQCPVCSSRDVIWPVVFTLKGLSTRNYYEFEAPTGSKICGDHEFEVSLDNTYLLFRISTSYMDRVQKRSEKSPRN